MKNKLSFLILFVIFLFLHPNVSNADNERNSLLKLFDQIIERVKNDYVEDINDKELIEKAIDGMLNGLDPHSGYMNEKVWEEMQIDTKGKFGGLGIEITMEDGFVKVISPIDDTPAFKAGVKAGDYIVQIDDTPVLGLTIGEAVELMRGERGEPIRITIVREGQDQFEIELYLPTPGTCFAA